jgi:glutamine synthetase
MASVALLVIDVQDELSRYDVTSNEYKHAVSFPRMIANTKKLVDAVRASRNEGNGGEVVFTFLEAQTNNSRDVSIDYKLSGYLSNLPNPGRPAKFIDGIAPVAGEDICLPKTSCSVFQSTNLDYTLRNLGVEQLVVCGQLTDQCVESAVRDAADLGYLVTVVNDACGAGTESDHEKGLHGMKGFSRIISTEKALQEMRNSESSGADDEWLLTHNSVIKGEVATAKTNAPSFTIPSASIFSLNKDMDYSYQMALLRSLRAAGVKFLRYAAVDAYNTIRCKVVPLAHARSLQRNETSSIVLPMQSPTSIAEVCFAGLPTHTDALVASSKLSAKNVLTLEPDFASLRVLPYASKTAMIMCTAHDQRTGKLSPLCTRGLLERVLQEARRDVGVQFSIGAELEFMLYRSGKPVDMSTFANTTTLNDQEDFISTLYDQLEQQDIRIETIHGESAPGQLEVVLSHSKDVLQLADDVLFARETIIACAKQYGMQALFLPKTAETQAGNGLHLHFSFDDISTGRSNSFSDPSRPSGISLKGESFIEGILNHLPSLLSFSLPTTNSFRRMGPGCWTGHEIGWSVEDKEVPIRVCVDLRSKQATNVEYKLSDSSANIYLELAMILSSGLQGMKQELELRPMLGINTTVPPVEMPTTLQASLNVLKADTYLLSMLGTELSTAYISVRESEANLNSKSTLEEEVSGALVRV